MDGNRGKALLGCVMAAALITPISSAHAAIVPVVPEPVSRAAEAAAFKAVFSTDCPGADLALFRKQVAASLRERALEVATP